MTTEINNKILADSYAETIDIEIATVLASAGNEHHTFSESFEKRMKQLINTEDQPKQRASRKRIRTLWLIAAAILILAAAACAVPAVRESIAGFFIRVFSNHVEYSDPEITKTCIEEEFELIPVPVGFAKADTSDTEFTHRVIYFDDADNVILFCQYAIGFGTEVIDNENGEFFDRVVDGNKTRVYIASDSAQAFWIENGYGFSLVCSFPLELHMLDELIASVGTE